MDPLFHDRHRIPADKFYPPVLDPNQHLSRPRLLKLLLRKGAGGSRRVLLLEAQAGQGKTTLAAQFLQQTKASFAWYQIGADDGDPVQFLTACLLCLKKALPGFRSPLLEQMIPRGEVPPTELPRFVNVLLSDLDKALKEEFWLVFDDLHLLEKFTGTWTLLSHLLGTAPPRLRFLLLTRLPLKLPGPLLQYHVCWVGNQDLAFSLAEVADLYNQIMEIPLVGKAARDLWEATEGWIMGLILAAHSVKTGASMAGKVAKGHLPDYFQAEVFAALPAELARTFLRLSPLEEIPAELAAQLSEVSDIRTGLNGLARKNLFIRQLDRLGTVFRFHHLFRDYLREKAAVVLSSAERLDVLRKCADFFLLRHDPERAIHFYLQISDYRRIEEILNRDGLGFVTMNRIRTLDLLLGHLAEEVVLDHPWIAFFIGMGHMEKCPPQALPYFERATELFAARQDRKGELLSLSQQILFHNSIDCQYHRGPELLQKAEALFPAARPYLDDRTTISIANHLSLGFFTMQVDAGKSRQYAEQALDLARKGGFLNLEAFARFTIGMQNAFFGKHQRVIEEIEAAWPLYHDAAVSSISRMHLRLLQLNCLALTGDFDNFFAQEEVFRRETEGDLVVQTVAGPILLVNKIDAALADGDSGLALERVEQGLAWGGPGDSPHLRSQFLHYQAMLYALLGRAAEARAAAIESVLLRRTAGGEMWRVVSDMIIGGALAQAGREEEAEDHLDRAIAGSGEFGEGFLRAGAHSYRAMLRLNAGQAGQGLMEVGECLRLMRENGYLHFFTWSPSVMRPLLETAVKNGIEADYARYLARARLGLAILDDGSSFPLLEISAFGGMSIAVGGKIVLRAEDLTKAQRDFLALLLVAPNLKRDQESIQHDLWPEAKPAKGRSNLDNLLLRVRKTLEEAVGPGAVKNYLSLQKGIVCLQNCRIDALQFMAHARKGLEHFRKKEFWQAGNAFHAADKLWKGPFLPNTPGCQLVQRRRDELDHIFIDLSLKWGELLAMSGRVEEGTEILKKAFRQDRTCDEVVRMLYGLFLQTKNLTGARSILTQYTENLRREEYSKEEIEEILEGVREVT